MHPVPKQVRAAFSFFFLAYKQTKQAALPSRLPSFFPPLGNTRARSGLLLWASLLYNCLTQHTQRRKLTADAAERAYVRITAYVRRRTRQPNPSSCFPTRQPSWQASAVSLAPSVYQTTSLPRSEKQRKRRHQNSTYVTAVYR